MAGLVVDPVCKMDVDPDTAAARSEYRGQTYYFCAEGCKLAFDQDPERYIAGGAATETPSARKRWWEFWKA
jgi:YHS domain-containing protein